MTKDIKIIKQKKITSDSGDIMHFMKNSDNSFIKFGEVYFSTIKKIQSKHGKCIKK